MTFFDASNLINLKSSIWYLSVQYSLFLFGFVLCCPVSEYRFLVQFEIPKKDHTKNFWLLILLS